MRNKSVTGHEQTEIPNRARVTNADHADKEHSPLHDIEGTNQARLVQEILENIPLVSGWRSDSEVV